MSKTHASWSWNTDKDKATSKAVSTDVSISKALSYILRHGAEKEGFTLHSGGFINVPDILKSRKFIGVTEERIRSIVDTSDKQRFALRNDPATGVLQIRANQGHSIQVEELELTPITSAQEFPEVIHGTFWKSWDSIQKIGLSRMNRNHIHFAIGKPEKKEVISGMRATAQVHIFLDLQKALNDGIPFYVSENKVVLSPGNGQGLIETKYFSKVSNAITGETIKF